MTNSNKAREFWLDPLLSPRNSIYTEPSESCIHVIEAEPTLALIAKLEEELTMGAFHHNSCPWLAGKDCCCAHTKVDSALKELAKWREGLK
jgi:hypothetical protein